MYEFYDEDDFNPYTDDRPAKSPAQIEREWRASVKAKERKEFWYGTGGVAVVILSIITGTAFVVAPLIIIAYFLYMKYHG